MIAVRIFDLMIILRKFYLCLITQQAHVAWWISLIGRSCSKLQTRNNALNVFSMVIFAMKTFGNVFICLFTVQPLRCELICKYVGHLVFVPGFRDRHHSGGRTHGSSRRSAQVHVHAHVSISNYIRVFVMVWGTGFIYFHIVWYIRKQFGNWIRFYAVLECFTYHVHIISARSLWWWSVVNTNTLTPVWLNYNIYSSDYESD